MGFPRSSATVQRNKGFDYEMCYVLFANYSSDDRYATITLTSFEVNQIFGDIA